VEEISTPAMLVAILIALGAPFAALIIATFIAMKSGGRFVKGTFGSLMNGAKNMGNAASKLGKRAAKNSAPGQAVQEYMNTRRAGTKLKGQEMYRRYGTQFPFLNYSKSQKQIFDAQNMKNYQEEVGRARGMMTTNVSRAFGDVRSNGANGYDTSAGLSGANLERIRNDGGYHDSSGSFIAFTQEDQNSLRRLETAGFLGGSGNRAGATAAMDELFDQQFVERRHVENLAQTAGTDPESSALFTQSIRSAAGRNKYKNYQYGHVENGSYNQWVNSPGTKDGFSIVESGTEGVPKEVYEDPAIQAGIAHKIREANAQGPEALERALIDVARQTKDVNKPAIINQIAGAMGMTPADFSTLRQAIQTNTLSTGLAVGGAVRTAVDDTQSAFTLNGDYNFSGASRDKKLLRNAARDVRDKRQEALARDPGSTKAQSDLNQANYVAGYGPREVV
jgi:hypothetical protein